MKYLFTVLLTLNTLSIYSFECRPERSGVAFISNNGVKHDTTVYNYILYNNEGGRETWRYWSDNPTEADCWYDAIYCKVKILKHEKIGRAIDGDQANNEGKIKFQIRNRYDRDNRGSRTYALLAEYAQSTVSNCHQAKIKYIEDNLGNE